MLFRRSSASFYKHRARDISGVSTLLMLMIVGSAVATAALTVTSLQIQSAKRGKETRQDRLNSTNATSVIQYLQLAMRNRWCINTDLTRDIDCSLSKPRSLEKLIISEANYQALVGGTYPGAFASLQGSIPSSGCDGSSSLLNDTESHPLRLLLEQLDQDYSCIHWRVRRACSASPDGGASSTSCPNGMALPAPIGDESLYSLYVELVPKNSTPLQLKQGNVGGEYTFSLIPRRIANYAAIFRGDLSANYDFSGGAKRPALGTDSTIRFPSSLDKKAPLISFHGPVLTNGDLILPNPEQTPNQFIQVQFNDAVYLEGGQVVTYANPCPTKYKAYCDPTTGKMPYIAGANTNLFSSSSGFGGLKGGVVQDATEDAGLACLLPTGYSGSSLNTLTYQKGCANGGNTGRLSAVLAAIDLKNPDKTSNSTLMIRKCDPTGVTATSDDVAQGCPSYAVPGANAPLVTTTIKNDESTDRSTWVIGLSNRNFFQPQIDLPGSSAAIVTNGAKNDTDGATYFDDVTTTGATRLPMIVPSIFPVNPYAVSNSAAPNTTPWAKFPYSDPSPLPSPNLDPRNTSMRNKPILRVHLVREDPNNYKSKSVIATAEMGINDTFSAKLNLDLATDPAAATLWKSSFCGKDNAGACDSLVTTTGSIVTHPLAHLELPSSCTMDSLFPAASGSPQPDFNTLGPRLRQLACTLAKVQPAVSAFKPSYVTQEQSLSSSCNTALSSFKANCDSLPSPIDRKDCKDLANLNPCTNDVINGTSSVSGWSSFTISFNKYHAFLANPDGSTATTQSYGDLRQAVVDLFSRNLTGPAWSDSTLLNEATTALTFLQGQTHTLNSLFYQAGQQMTQTSGAQLRFAVANHILDTKYLTVVGVSVPTAPGGGARLPQIDIQTIPVVNKHPLLPISGSTTENVARYYWRSDLVRLNTRVLNADLFPAKLRKFQIEFEAYDAIAQDSSGKYNGTLRPRSSNDYGPNCSIFKKGEKPNEHCNYSTNDDAQDYEYFRKSPNLIRYTLGSQFDSTKVLSTGLAAPVNNSYNLKVEIVSGVPKVRENLPTNPTPPRFYIRSEGWSRAALLQSCSGPSTPSSALFSINLGWQSMRCPDFPTVSYFPDNYSPPSGAQWEIQMTQLGGALLGTPTFKGAQPTVSQYSYDPMELLSYDFYQMGGSDALSMSDSFAAHTATLSWDFKRPSEQNTLVMINEAAKNIAISGPDATEAETWIISDPARPMTAYPAGTASSFDANLAGQLWSPQAADGAILVFSLLNQCVVLPSAEIVAGFMTCNRLQILPRSTPLTFVGTFIIGQLDVAPTISAPIDFYHLDHTTALQILRNNGFLKTKDQNPCPLIYGSNSVPSIFKMTPQQRNTYATCEPASIRGQAIPFTWTVIDPECGWDDISSTWKCSAPNWFKRFRILNLSHKGDL